MISRVDIVYTIYQELFSVNFIHSGYGMPLSNTIVSDFKLRPDKSTNDLFRDHGIGYRIFNDTLVCFIRSKRIGPASENGKIPYIPFAGDVLIRFLMFPSARFASKTHVVAAGKQKVYQFTNKINNFIDPDKFISKPVEDYAVANDYDDGTIVKQGSQLFTSIKPVLAAESIAITNTGFWLPLLPVEQVVNNADLADPIRDPLTGMVKEPCFAIIDIYNNGTTNTGYDLFSTDAERRLKSPVYAIRFKSKT